MKINEKEITTQDILDRWGQGKTTLDWRPLTIKGKREWLKALRWSCLGGHFFCQISKQILFKTEDGETHPLAVNRSVLGGARKVI
jgi:hypothetical protein